MEAKKEAEYLFRLHEKGYINVDKIKAEVKQALTERRILMAEQFFLLMISWPKLNEESKQEIFDLVKKADDERVIL